MLHSLSATSPAFFDSSSSSSLCIISQSLPLSQCTSSNTQDEKKEEQVRGNVTTVITPLPPHIVTACVLDTLIGFICVDNTNASTAADHHHPAKHDGHDDEGRNATLPWLCLYTAK